MKKRANQAIIALLIPAILCLPIVAQQPQTITGRVVGIVDGDTLDILTRANRQIRIRFHAIDSPERAQPFYNQATQSLGDLVFGRDVSAHCTKVDTNKRPVCKVTLNGRDIGLLQIDRGMAWFSRNYAHELSRNDARAYERAEMNARAERRGLWIDPAPMPPWEWRAQQRGPVAGIPPVTNGAIIGNRNSRLYHRPDCPAYNDVSERNRVYFKTVEQAERAGYRVASNCPRVF
jgi:endonuclease YncB( thermonuclease family)